MNSAYFLLFLEEANELWPEGLQALQTNGDWQTVFLRVAHTLKGMSGTMGYSSLAEAFHQAEDAVRAKQAAASIMPLWLQIGTALDRATATQSESELKQFTLSAKIAVDSPTTTPANTALHSQTTTSRSANRGNSEQQAAFLRVEIERLETMFETIGLLQTRMRVLSQVPYGSPAWDREFRNIQALVTRSSHHIAGVRLSSLKPLANLFEQSLKEAAASANKPVLFYARGANLRVAREVVERFRPLIPHIARNVIAHGIETADLRVKRGKPPQGNVEFAAAQDGTDVLLFIRDDGGGVDLSKLRQKAQTQGLTGLNSEEQLLDLLFQPGFSTTTEANTLSGRGVGLDAVKDAVEAAGGSISIRQSYGQFFEIRLRIPVPLLQQRLIEVSIGDTPIGVLDEDWQPTDNPGTTRSILLPGQQPSEAGIILANNRNHIRVRTWRSLGSVNVHRLSPPLNRLPGAVGFYLDEGGAPRLVYRAA